MGQGAHFAYTQTSFWNLKSASKPFDDTSYKPELFFLSSGSSLFPTKINRLFIQTGYQHESNGRDGESSRATDQYVNRLAENLLHYRERTNAVRVGVSLIR